VTRTARTAAECKAARASTLLCDERTVLNSIELAEQEMADEDVRELLMDEPNTNLEIT
jgi:hypothetical protein